MIGSYDDFLNLFAAKPRIKSGKGVLVLCPAHNDHSPSLLVRPSKNSDFIATWDCQAGCTRENVLKAVRLTWADVTHNGNGKGVGGYKTNGKPCQPVNGAQKRDQNRVDTTVDTQKAKVSTVNGGVTLSQLAEAKKLPVDFLKSVNVSDFKYMGAPSVKIPYYSEDGTEIAVRFRVSLSGDCRFKWRKGDHAAPYGLQTLDRIRQAGWVLVVEGESDCWTAWHHNIPALGAPGKKNWPPAWGEFLKGVEVFLWQEPEAEDFTLRVLASAPDLRYIVAPEGIKDISEAHIQGINLPEWLEGLKSKAEYGRELKARSDSEQIKAVYQVALPVINSDDPLILVKEAIKALGYGGDTKPVLITYLAATSRLLEMRAGAMPDHLILIGPPSAGKSYTVKQVLTILPPEAYHVIDAGSPRALIYDDSDLQHRVVIFSEADSLPAGEDNPAASAVRNLLQDHYLHYTVAVRDPVTGDYIVREINKPGPTVLITTSVKPLGQQLMTRMFILEVSDSESQIKAALEAQALLETEGIKTPDNALIAYQLYLQLKAPFKVVVPFAKELAKAMANVKAAPRILRDFARLMSLIKSVALLRHRNRVIDSSGQIMATVDDYKCVRELVNDMYINTSSGITPEVREFVNKVIELDQTRTSEAKITNTTIANELGIGVKQASRRAVKALRMGWIVNREQRKSYPADYQPGEPMPEVDGLPPAEGLTVDTVDIPLTPPLSTVNEAKNEGVDRLTPLTDGSIPPYTPINCHPPCNKCDSYQKVDGKYRCINPEVEK